MLKKDLYKNFKKRVELTVCGIPCQAVILSFLKVPAWTGPASTCPSDLDYYGYEEIEYVLLDRKGYKADWLAKKIPSTELDSLVLEAYKRQFEGDY